jgi:hypothetical protein
MPLSRFFLGVWVALLIGAAFAATQAQPAPEESWIWPLVVAVWALSAAGLIASPLRRFVGAPARWLRAHAILYWLALLAYVCGALLLWVVPYQPNNGHPMTAVEFVYLAAALWGLVYLLAYDAHEPELRAMGARLGKSKLTGLLVTLTTVIFVLMGAETYLRIFYVTTDGYGFTAMDYWWYKNFGWSHLNSLGYRDYEPTPDAPGLTRVAVLGDSFAMGHGINNIDDTLAQVLERDLGAGYDVNLIAESGWDSDIELYNLDRYPLRPNVVVLSYYLNDIDYLLTDASNPDANFALPQNDATTWATRNFFLASYVYYNLLQFTSSARTSSFAYDLISAHMDDKLWDQQVPRLVEMVAWAQRNNARLIALVWPQLAEVDASTPATKRVGDFFRSQGVTVVDMTDILRGRSVGEITVNRFDAHPNAEADRLAAEALAQAIKASGS